LWKTLDRRDLLIFSLLLHDTGKGVPTDNHVLGSLESWTRRRGGWDFPQKKRPEVIS